MPQAAYSQNYPRNSSSTAAYNASLTSNNHTPNHISSRTQPYPSNFARHYQQRSYNNYPREHFANRPQNWSRNPRFKRARLDSCDQNEPKSKASKKKKKPLSLNIPSKKEWTIQEAEMALAVEKECNKRSKNQSLLIKFPDLELNKEIVASYHSAIENVHFQQPSAPRFCFVTLKESADPDTVIKELNKQKFGDGYITAEYKKDREEDQNVGPEDIDPLTLYVGNLAQEITKDDMVKTYPKVRRIDIGYAKKMKYTRYAFVSFSTVADAIEAFKKTHSTQLHSKSLIVRFRRLHGPVGMPGETKQQNPPKNKNDTPGNSTENGHPSLENSLEHHTSNEDVSITFRDSLSPGSINCDTYECLSRSPQLDLTVVKREPQDVEDVYPDNSEIRDDFDEDYTESILDQVFAQHRPKVKKEVKPVVKTEQDGFQVNQEVRNRDILPVRIKEEPVQTDERQESNVNVVVKHEPDAATRDGSFSSGMLFLIHIVLEHLKLYTVCLQI